jgi:hypothetical protein
MKYCLLIPCLLFFLNVSGQNPVERDSLELSLYGSQFYVNYLIINKFDTALLNELKPPVYLFNDNDFKFGKN